MMLAGVALELDLREHTLYPSADIKKVVEGYYGKFILSKCRAVYFSLYISKKLVI